MKLSMRIFPFLSTSSPHGIMSHFYQQIPYKTKITRRRRWKNLINWIHGDHEEIYICIRSSNNHSNTLPKESSNPAIYQHMLAHIVMCMRVCFTRGHHPLLCCLSFTSISDLKRESWSMLIGCNIPVPFSSLSSSHLVFTSFLSFGKQIIFCTFLLSLFGVIFGCCLSASKLNHPIAPVRRKNNKNNNEKCVTFLLVLFIFGLWL